MKVSILRPVSVGALGSFSPGDVVDLPPSVAADLVSIRKASPIVEVREAEPVREVAAVAPVVETADAPVVSARRKVAKK